MYVGTQKLSEKKEKSVTLYNTGDLNCHITIEYRNYYLAMRTSELAKD